MPGIDPIADAAPGVDGAGARPQPKDSPAAVADAARQFEALLIIQLLRAARGESEEWLGEGEDPTASSAMELAEEQFAGALAAQGGMGLASLIVSGLKPR